MAGWECGRVDDIAYVIERLSVEFASRIDPDTIRRVATQEVELFDNAKVRDFISPIALQLARSRLIDLLEDTHDTPISAVV